MVKRMLFLYVALKAVILVIGKFVLMKKGQRSCILLNHKEVDQFCQSGQNWLAVLYLVRPGIGSECSEQNYPSAYEMVPRTAFTLICIRDF